MDPKPNQESGSGSSPEYSKYVMTPQKIIQHLVFFRKRKAISLHKKDR